MEENPRINEINDMLDHLEDILEDSKQAFLSARVVVEKDEILEIIKDIRLRLPNEIQQSRWVVEDRTKILAGAQLEADKIIEEAHEIVDKMVMEHEITQYAQEEANNIINVARADARELQLGAVEYADGVLKDVERHLKDTLDLIHNEVSGFEAYMGEIVRTIYENRKELKGIVPSQSVQDFQED